MTCALRKHFDCLFVSAACLFVSFPKYAYICRATEFLFPVWLAVCNWLHAIDLTPCAFHHFRLCSLFAQKNRPQYQLGIDLPLIAQRTLPHRLANETALSEHTLDLLVFQVMQLQLKLFDFATFPSAMHSVHCTLCKSYLRSNIDLKFHNFFRVPFLRISVFNERSCVNRLAPKWCEDADQKHNLENLNLFYFKAGHFFTRSKPAFSDFKSFSEDRLSRIYANS